MQRLPEIAEQAPITWVGIIIVVGLLVFKFFSSK